MKPKKSSGKSAGKRSKKRSDLKDLDAKRASSVKGGQVVSGTAEFQSQTIKHY